MAECPICKEKVGANDFLASEDAACSACGNRPLASGQSEPWWASAAPLEASKMKSAPADSQSKSRPSAPAAPEPNVQVRTQLAPTQRTIVSQPNEREAVPTEAHPPQPSSRRVEPSKTPLPPPDAFDDDDEPTTWLDRLRNIDLGSALALLCFGVALVFSSFYQLEPAIKPIAALGLLAGLLGGLFPALWRKRNPALPALMSLLCLLMLLFVGTWPSFSSAPPPLMTVPLASKGMGANQAVSEDDWVDASANAVKRGDVRIEIISAWIAPVELKRRSSTATSSERFLVIRLRASYEGILFQQTPYEPWADRADSPSQHSPTLTDNKGRSYAQKTFDSGSKVVGRADSDALNPGHQVKEVLVFPVPARDVEHLRLTLPAPALGLPGEFRFQIPRSMIRGL